MILAPEVTVVVSLVGLWGGLGYSHTTTSHTSEQEKTPTELHYRAIVFNSVQGVVYNIPVSCGRCPNYVHLLFITIEIKSLYIMVKCLWISVEHNIGNRRFRENCYKRKSASQTFRFGSEIIATFPELSTRQFYSFATTTTRQCNRASGTRKNSYNV